MSPQLRTNGNSRRYSESGTPMSWQSARRIAVVWATTRTRPSGCCWARSCRHVGEPGGGLDRVLPVGQVVGHRVGAERRERVREAVSHLGRGQALTGAEVQFAEPFVDVQWQVADVGAGLWR